MCYNTGLVKHLQNDKVLREIYRSEHVACREGWFDNLTSTVFHISLTVSGSEEQDKIEDKYNEAIAGLELGLDQHIQDAIQKGVFIQIYIVSQHLVQHNIMLVILVSATIWGKLSNITK